MASLTEFRRLAEGVRNWGRWGDADELGTLNFITPDKVAQARTMVVRDIKQMQDTPVSADELHTAKGMLLRQIALGESSFQSIAGRLLELSLEGKPLNSYTVAAQKYLDLDAPAIEAAFKKYLKPDDFVTAVKGPASKTGA